MNVLSLFDGMRCGMLALEKAGIDVENYYSSEIDKYSIKVAMEHEKNYTNTDFYNMGDITKINISKRDDGKVAVIHHENGVNYIDDIDILIGGSPCQSFSTAGNGEGFDGKSKLFWEYVRLLKEIKPKYFLLENVVMRKDWEKIITEAVGVEPIKINSELVSAQSRPRLYWTNIPGVEQPGDLKIMLKDILEDDVDLKYALSDSKIDRVLNTKRGKGFFYDKTYEKTSTLIAGYHKLPTDGIYIDLGFKRKLTPTECEKLQTVPVGYTECVSDTQRYKMLGNGWTINVIAHILSNIPKED